MGGSTSKFPINCEPIQNSDVLIPENVKITTYEEYINEYATHPPFTRTLEDWNTLYNEFEPVCMFKKPESSLKKTMKYFFPTFDKSVVIPAKLSFLSTIVNQYNINIRVLTVSIVTKVKNTKNIYNIDRDKKCFTFLVKSNREGSENYPTIAIGYVEENCFFPVIAKAVEPVRLADSFYDVFTENLEEYQQRKFNQLNEINNILDLVRFAAETNLTDKLAESTDFLLTKSMLHESISQLSPNSNTYHKFYTSFENNFRKYFKRYTLLRYLSYQLLEQPSIKDGKLFSRYSNYLLNKLDTYNKQKKIVFIGDTGSGKSSIINLIIGLDLLPTGSGGCTIIPIEIAYGSMSCILGYNKSKQRVLTSGPFNLTEYKACITNYATASKNSKKYTKLVIRLPITLLLSGISLVDTPGLTSNRHHYDKTPEDDTVDKIIRKSESIFAVVWVLSSQNGFNQSFKLGDLMRILSNSKENSQAVSTNPTEIIQPEGIDRSLFILNYYDSIINEESGDSLLKMGDFVKINWSTSTKPEKIVKSIASDFTDFLSGKQHLAKNRQGLFDEFFDKIGKFLHECFKLRIKSINEVLFLLQRNIGYTIDVNLSSSLDTLLSVESRFYQVKQQAEEQKKNLEEYLGSKLKKRHESIKELILIHLDTHFIDTTVARILAINPKTREEFDNVFESQCLASWEHYLRWLDFNFYKKINLDAIIAHGNSLFNQTWTEIFEIKSLIWSVSRNDYSSFRNYFKFPVNFAKHLFQGPSNWQVYSRLESNREKKAFLRDLICKKYLENNMEEVDCKFVITQLFTPLENELAALQKIFKAKKLKQDVVQINHWLLNGITAITRWIDLTYLSDCHQVPPFYKIPTYDHTFQTSTNRVRSDPEHNLFYKEFIFLRSKESDNQDVYDNSNSLDQFCQEKNILQKLDHPNILKLHSWFVLKTQEAIIATLVMPLYTPLTTYWEQQPDLPYPEKIAEFRSFIKQTASALFYMHTQFVIHRDIKADNILLANNNATIVVADVGIAREMKTFGKTKSGTPGYFALESMESGFFSTKSDIYSFGILAWEFWHRQRVSSGRVKDELGWVPAPANEDRNLFQSLTRCRVVDPYERPGLEDIIKAAETDDSEFADFELVEL